MAIEITLSDLPNLENQTSAVTTINSNNSIIESALQSALSRNGVNPNEMSSDLDLNSHRILNAAAPISQNDVLRLSDLTAFLGPGSIIIPNNSLGIQSKGGTNYTYVSGDAYQLTARANSGVAMVDTLSSSTTGNVFFITNSDATALLLIQTTGGRTLDGSVSNFLLLGPGQSAIVQSDGSNYKTISKPYKCYLAADTTFYVGTTGTDTVGKGLAAITPFATHQYAYNFLRDNIHTKGFTVTIQTANGTYSSNFNAIGVIPGVISANQVVIKGDIVTPSNVTITSGSITISGSFGAMFQLYGIRVASTANHGVASADGGTVIEINFMDFGSCIGAHQYCTNYGTIRRVSDYNVSQEADSHIECVVYGFYDSEGAFKATFLNAISYNFNNAFCDSRYCGFVDHKSGTWDTATHGATVAGKRYNAGSQGMIHTQGGGANYFPGSIAGTSTGGYYD